jgi:hypothetical protein
VERSLTVLLPVHNVQSSLADMVSEVLEVVSELTEKFELVIVDDGSADATSEVAQELTCRYPQVRAVCHGQCLGRDAAIRTGLEHSSGQTILLRDETHGIALDAIGRLWPSAGPQEPAPQEPPPPGSGRLTHLSPRHTVRRPGYQVLDRQAMERQHCRSQPRGPNYLRRLRDLALGE